MTKFIVNIWAYDRHTKFQVEAEDNSISLEQSIVDKLGDNSIKWEYLGNSYDSKTNRITFEEVIDAKTSGRPLQTKKVLGVELGTGAS